MKGAEGGKKQLCRRCDGSTRRVDDERHESGTCEFLCPAEEAALHLEKEHAASLPAMGSQG